MKVFDIFKSFEITINDNLETYNYYRLKYTPISDECEEEYNKIINSNLELENIIEQINNISNKYINKSIDLSIKILYEKGIHNVDRDLFIDKYYKYFNFNEYMSSFLDKYIEINSTAEELARYRQWEKLNRGKWQGGGFGLTGAIKGAMMAGTLNMGSNIVRSFSDSAKASSDKSKIRSLERKLLKEYKKNSKIIIGLLECIFGCLSGLMDELASRNLVKSVSINKKEAIAIYNNTKKYESDPSKILENYFKAIIKYPYYADFYEKLYEYDCRDEGLLELVEFFGMTHDCMYYKIKYEDIKKEEERIELEKRTFMGKTYESIEECNLAKKEYNEIYTEYISYLDQLVTKMDLDLNKYNSQNFIKAKSVINKIEKNYPKIAEDEIRKVEIKNFISKCAKVEKYAYNYRETKNLNFQIDKADYLDSKDRQEPMSYKGIFICTIIMFLEMIYLNEGLIRTVLSIILIVSIIGNIVDNLKNNKKKKEFLNLIIGYYD